MVRAQSAIVPAADILHLKRLVSDVSSAGAPFCAASVTGLTEISAHWTRLGIRHERIDPSQPQQNGRHERFHPTLKEAMLSSQNSQDEQQHRFNRFRHDYNHEHPHEALGQKPPGRFYQPSPRPMPARIPEPNYPAGTKIRRVRSNGEIKWRGHKIYISTVIAGEEIALREIDNDLWSTQFYDRALVVQKPSSHLDDDLAFCSPGLDIGQGIAGRCEGENAVHDRPYDAGIDQ